MISHNSIDTELRFYQTVQERMRADLLTFPKGDVFFKLEHGRKRPYTKINGRKKYLGTRNIEYVQRVMQRKEYEKSLYLIGQNIEALHALRSRFHDLVHIVPASFALPDKFLSRKERAAIAERWAEVRKVQVLPPETFAREGEKTPRKFKTSDGIYVKSRAELFIYEYLKAHGIMFLYERPFHANGKTYYPDFTIIRASDGEMILWEHFGMMSLDWYLRNTQEKLYDYSCEGFWPFRNIIATYEFNEDDLDASEIERILKMMESCRFGKIKTRAAPGLCVSSPPVLQVCFSLFVVLHIFQAEMISRIKVSSAASLGFLVIPNRSLLQITPSDGIRRLQILQQPLFSAYALPLHPNWLKPLQITGADRSVQSTSTPQTDCSTAYAR